MKRYIKSIMMVGLFSLALVNTSCIEETEPTDVATQDQAERSSSATKAQAMAIPAQLGDMDDDYVDRYNWHAPFGYPALLIIRDMMCNDAGFPTSSYAYHFYYFGANMNLDGRYIYIAYVWTYYYKLIQAANSIISVVNPETATKDQLGYLGAAYAVRAMAYMDMARMYEFLPNDKTSSVNSDGNDVLGLTVPIVTPDLTEEQARNNPRAKKADMVAFIEGDIAEAKKYIDNISDRLNRTMPNLACVYGLEARLNMWKEDYPAAAVAAQQAIDASGMTPLSEAVALDKASGMNTYTQFMWCVNLVKESDAVQSGIVNFTSWMSNQTTYGYTGAATGQYVICDKNFYERISDTDWRKKWWQAPEGSSLRDQSSKNHIEYLSAEEAEALPTYASVKFRPGQGNQEDYNVGSATAIPLMRVEEMYFIKAEAEAQSNPAAGIATLTDFMTKYRDPSYSTKASTKDEAVDEIIFQKRVELWGEGQLFFDYKRLNMSVTRGYEGTPFFDRLRLNTNGRPAWMNLVISVSEYQDNQAVNHWNNPDPSGLYTQWK
jgi:hypothetical protein